MTKFEFVDAPIWRTQRGVGDPLICEFAEALKESPGRWAKWPKPASPSSVPNFAARINYPDKYPHCCHPALVGDEFEATTRRGELFVRYKVDPA